MARSPQPRVWRTAPPYDSCGGEWRCAGSPGIRSGRARARGAPHANWWSALRVGGPGSGAAACSCGRHAW
eukprot:10501682-Alexandrium_andersonii.AAC.1